MWIKSLMCSFFFFLQRQEYCIISYKIVQSELVWKFIFSTWKFWASLRYAYLRREEILFEIQVYPLIENVQSCTTLGDTWNDDARSRS